MIYSPRRAARAEVNKHISPLYFKVIFRQNEIQYFTTHIYIYTTQRESICHVGGKKDYTSEAKHDKENSY